MKYKNNLLLPILSLLSPYAQSEVILDGSMGTAGALPGPNYQITEDLGQRAGGNLFHSFEQFNINSAESATFSGSAGINNVISRTTGGQPSNIDGAFRSTIPGANMFFVNPAGVFFGENASLDVQGSFHASTANYLSFKDSVKFETGVSAANPILTTAAPEAFGFLDNTPASISVAGGENKLLRVPKNATFSLVGGNINIKDRALYAPGGQVVLASAGSAGEVVFNESGIDTSSFAQGGIINISRAADHPIATIGEQEVADIDVSANAAGKVVIRGGQMTIDNAYIWSKTTNGHGRGIDIALKGDLTLKGVPESPTVKKTPKSGISVGVLGNGNAGNFLLNIDNLKLTHGTEISSYTESLSSGQGGDLAINANSILLEGNASKAVPHIITTTSGTGKAGNIIINNAGKLDVNNNAYITTIAGDKAKGSTGNIFLKADSINIDNAAIRSSHYGYGIGGNLNIITKNLIADNSAVISSYVLKNGTSKGGGIYITAEDSISLAGNDTSIGSFSAGQGAGGNIEVKSNNLNIGNEAKIMSSSTSTGNTGDLTVDAKHIDSQGQIFTSSEGDAGNIHIKANTLHLSGETAMISSIDFSVSDKDNLGNTGNITIEGRNDTDSTLTKAKQITMRDGASITTNTSNGKGGDLTINAEQLRLDHSKLSSVTFGTGNTGNIEINSELLKMQNTSAIFSGGSRGSTGQNGDINLNIKDLAFNDSFLSTGVAFKPGTLEPSLDFNSINNRAGNIIINTWGTINLENKSFLGTFSTNDNAGNITIKGGRILRLKGDSKIISGVNLGDGKGGDIFINTPIVVLDESFITSGADNENGGDITLTGHLFLSALSTITASSKKSADGELKLKPDTNISGSLAELPESALNVSDQLSVHCGTLSEVNKNSFVIKGRGGIPLNPGKSMPSTFIDMTPSTNQTLKSTKKENNPLIKKQSDSFVSLKQGDFLPFPQQVDCDL